MVEVKNKYKWHVYYYRLYGNPEKVHLDVVREQSDGGILYQDIETIGNNPKYDLFNTERTDHESLEWYARPGKRLLSSHDAIEEALKACEDIKPLVRLLFL